MGCQGGRSRPMRHHHQVRLGSTIPLTRLIPFTLPSPHANSIKSMIKSSRDKPYGQPHTTTCRTFTVCFATTHEPYLQPTWEAHTDSK